MVKNFRAYEEKNSRVVRRRIRKGVPQPFRGLVWKELAGVSEVMRQNKGVYEVYFSLRVLRLLVHLTQRCHIEITKATVPV